MPTPPAAVSETYVACNGLPCTINGITMRIIEGGFDPGFDVDDMTNNSGGGFYEDVETVKKATFTATVAYKGTADALGWHSGDIYPLQVNYVPGTPPTAGNPSISGNFRFHVSPDAMLNTKAGLKLKITGTSQGAYVHVI